MRVSYTTMAGKMSALFVVCVALLALSPTQAARDIVDLQEFGLGEYMLTWRSRRWFVVLTGINTPRTTMLHARPILREMHLHGANRGAWFNAQHPALLYPIQDAWTWGPCGS